MIEEEENFDIDWLNERYPFDAEARNKPLETKVLNQFKEKEKLTLVDVGAGTGSNCLYFIEKLPQHQKWYLIEQNADLRKATIRRLKDYAGFHKYDFEKKKDTYKITSIQRKVEVHIINDSLMKLDDLVPVKKVDMVFANAVFDLFPSEQIKQFSELLLQHQLDFYATLNYEGMAFHPDDPFDTTFVDTYNEHMERPQPFGKAMGKNAAPFMLDFFEQQKVMVQSGSSVWKVAQDDIKMHYYLLNFMENALEEMDLEVMRGENFQKWIQRKKDLIITRQQRLEVGHLDILVKG